MKKNILFGLLLYLLIFGSIYVVKKGVPLLNINENRPLPPIESTSPPTDSAIVGLARTAEKFILNERFRSVRNIMMQDDVNKAILEAGGNELLESRWLNRNVTLFPFRVDGQLDLRLKSGSDVLNKSILPLRQDIKIDNNVLLVQTYLTQPVGNLLAYKAITMIHPNGSKSEVTLTVATKIAFTEEVRDQQTANEIVAKYNQQQLELLHDVMTKLIEG